MRSVAQASLATLGLTIAVCMAMLLTAATPAAGVGRHSAYSARTLNGTDTAHLHLVHQDETLLYEEGSASGALPGRMRAELTVGSIFTGSCTIYTRGGSITGHGRATPKGSGRYQSFSGYLQITAGSGRYAHVRGRTRLGGTFDRRTFSLVLQTAGDLSY